MLVFGRFNKFKKGPAIVNINPTTEDIKNVGNLNKFSQKSGILFILWYIYILRHLTILLRTHFNNSCYKINFILNPYIQDVNMFKYGLIAQSARAGDS